jgi:hypothetical protein
MSDSEFLSFLVDETLKLHASGEAQDFETKLRDYKLGFLKGEFIPQIQVVRFVSPIGILDFPVNWSVFNLEWAGSQDTLLESNSDPDHLLELIQENCFPTISKLLITHSQGLCYIVGFRPEEEVYLHDILNHQDPLSTAA